jgi:hypothetical protein
VDPFEKIGGKVFKFHSLSMYAATYVFMSLYAGACAWERSRNINKLKNISKIVINI